jgi:hypothetical protein
MIFGLAAQAYILEIDIKNKDRNANLNNICRMVHSPEYHDLESIITAILHHSKSLLPMLFIG